uniref:Uncharacterized protein n=1 Tax=Tetradesmus obliquus TaxID=3088 RepID=A0A383VY49_TETOB
MPRQVTGRLVVLPGSQQQQFCDRFQVREPPQTFQQSKKYSFTPLETQRTLTKHPRRWFPDIHRQHGTRRPRSTAGARAQGGDVSAPATSSSDSRSKGAAAQAAPRGC